MQERRDKSQLRLLHAFSFFTRGWVNTIKTYCIGSLNNILVPCLLFCFLPGTLFLPLFHWLTHSTNIYWVPTESVSDIVLGPENTVSDQETQSLFSWIFLSGTRDTSWKGSCQFYKGLVQDYLGLCSRGSQFNGLDAGKSYPGGGTEILLAKLVRCVRCALHSFLSWVDTKGSNSNWVLDLIKGSCPGFDAFIYFSILMKHILSFPLAYFLFLK